MALRASSRLSSGSSSGSGFEKGCTALRGSKDAARGCGNPMFSNLRGVQRRILSVLAAAGRSMYLREIAEVLHRDKRRVHDALKRLLRRGLVQRLSGGRYAVPRELRHEVLSFLSGRRTPGRSIHTPGRGAGSKDGDGTGVPRAARVPGGAWAASPGAAVSWGSGAVVRLDNVRGWRGSLYYAGDRFGDRAPSFLGLLDRVSYFEVSLKWDAPRNEVFVAVYYSGREGVVKVEFRPYRGDRDVARGDWRGVLRRGVLDMLRWALRALKAAVRELGIGVFAEALEVFREGERYVVRNLEQVDPDEIDALVIPGGYSPDALRTRREVVEFVRRLHEKGKVIAAICHGPQVLISAGIVKGRRVTAYRAVRDDLVNAGAVFVDEPVVVDGNIITARVPDDLPEFCRAIIEALEKRGS